jgi:glycosyltransferase involved in cell wall biosynthesis
MVDGQISSRGSVSIVIPAYNAERFLPATLESVRNQTHTDWECVIVDDCSQDNTPAIAEHWARKDARFRVVRRATNGGVGAARNEGFQAFRAGADYVTFLDNDDVWHPNTLQILIESLLAEPAWSAVIGRCALIDENGTSVKDVQLEERCFRRLMCVNGNIQSGVGESPLDFASLILQNPIMTPGMALMRNRALDAVAEEGLVFDQKLAPCDDWDIWLRLSRHGPIGLANQRVLDYRRHSSNASRKATRMGLAARRLRWKTFRQSKNIEERKHVANAYAAWWRHIRIERLRYGIAALRRMALIESARMFGLTAVNAIDELRTRVMFH